jgi:hypothetical protein
VSVHTPEPVDNPPAFAAGVEFLKAITPQTRLFLYGEGPDNALRYEWRPYVSHLVARRRAIRLVRALSSDLFMHRRVPLLASIRQLTGARAHRKRWREPFPDWLNEEFAERCGCREMGGQAADDFVTAPRAASGLRRASARFDGNRCSTTATSTAP